MKTQKWFAIVNDHSRATYYVLPLIYLNKFSFGDNNFVNAYTSAKGDRVMVQVKDTAKVPGGPWIHEHLIKEQDGVFHFEIPLVLKDAVAMFLVGRYSEMGDMAHGLIRAYSGLNYMRPRVNDYGLSVTDTDARIHALDKHPDLRAHLEAYLSFDPGGRVGRSIVTIDPDSELMSPPQEWEIWKDPLMLEAPVSQG